MLYPVSSAPVSKKLTESSLTKTHWDAPPNTSFPAPAPACRAPSLWPTASPSSDNWHGRPGSWGRESVTQVFQHATSQALPQFLLLHTRPGDAFRDDPRPPGTRWEPGLGDCHPPTLPESGLICTHGECPGTPLFRASIAAHQLRPPAAWPPPGAHHWEPPPRTLTGAQGGPEASAWAAEEAGPTRGSPAHRRTLRTNQRSLRLAPTPPLGLSAAQSKREAGAPGQSEVGEACQAWEKNLEESARPWAWPGPDGQREAPMERFGERPGAAGSRGPGEWAALYTGMNGCLCAQA